MRFVDTFIKELLEASPREEAEKLHSTGKKTVGKLVLAKLRQEGFSDSDIALVKEELKKLKTASDRLSGIEKGATGPKQTIAIIDKDIIPELRKIITIFGTLNSVHSVKNSKLKDTNHSNIQTEKDDRKYGTSAKGRSFLISKREDLIKDTKFILNKIESLKKIESLNAQIEDAKGSSKIKLVKERMSLKKKYNVESNNVKGLIFKATSDAIKLATSVAAEVKERKVRKGTRTKEEFNSIAKDGVEQNNTVKSSKTVGIMKSGFGKNPDAEVDAEKASNIKKILNDMITSLSDYSDPLNGVSDLNKELRIRTYYLQGAQSKIPNDKRNTKRVAIYKNALRTISTPKVTYGVLRTALDPVKADLESVRKRDASDRSNKIRIVVKDPANIEATKNSKVKRTEADKKRMDKAANSISKAEDKTEENKGNDTVGAAVDKYIKNAEAQQSKVLDFFKDISSGTISDKEVKSNRTLAKNIINKYKGKR